jgi:CTP-dependent riboflavin kinase
MLQPQMVHGNALKEKYEIMNYRMYALSAMAAALFVVNGTAFAAEDAKNATHEGKLVSITGNKLVMASQDNKEHSHTLSTDAKLTLDGKVVQAGELKPGTRIRVTTTDADKSMANRVEALVKNREFAGISRDGQVVSVNEKQLVMIDKANKKEQTCTFAADAKITCDGKLCKAADLKRGMKVRVTSESAAPHAATRIEAIDKNLDFVSL